MRSSVSSALFIAVGLFLGTPTANCQSIRGVVLSAADSSAISMATVQLVDLESGTPGLRVTDGQGRFAVVSPPGQINLLEVSALGYFTYTDTIFVWDSEDQVELQIHLGVDAIPLDPIVVSGSPRPIWETTQPPYLWEFFQRQQFYTRLGGGRFFDAGTMDIRFGPVGTLTLLETLWPASAYRTWGDLCKAEIFLDGMPFRGELSEVPFSIHDLAGVELHGWKGPVPVEFWTESNPPCRVIALWTQRPVVSEHSDEDSLGGAWFMVILGFAALMLGGGG